MSPQDPEDRSQRPTEAVLKSSRGIDRLDLAEVLAIIQREDHQVFFAVQKVLPEIARCAEVLVAVLGKGGRWFNAGAGTSGRLGVLDASEIPPTFGMDPEVVQGVIAGGETALVRAVEGAEDDGEAAAYALMERGLEVGDAVLAISASGWTPFAIGALEAAKSMGARRLALTCDPASPLAEVAEVAIVPEVGPEVIAGSTRMKGGLAQKMVLHQLSTAVMVKLGRVEGNRMTHLSLGSEKLRARALRIAMDLGKLTEEEVAELLQECDGDIAAVMERVKKNR